ncbi:MAG: hypothetical protein WCI72_04560 [archaeon]
MAVNFMQICTAGFDLQQGISKVYEGKKYRNPDTNDVYEFVSFPECVSGENVLVRNVTRDISELLSAEDWFSFRRIPENESERQKP